MALRHPVTSEDHIQGNPLAPIELLEYGDYQCPHCGRAYPLVKNLHSFMGDRLKFIFRNFPLAEVHPQARGAAIAAEASAIQGKFWEMHDKLFENQRHLNRLGLLTYGLQLELDMEKFEADMGDPDLEKKVEAEFYGGLRSGVNATPTFFVNGARLEETWEGDGLLIFLKSRFPELF